MVEPTASSNRQKYYLWCVLLIFTAIALMQSIQAMRQKSIKLAHNINQSQNTEVALVGALINFEAISVSTVTNRSGANTASAVNPYKIQYAKLFEKIPEISNSTVRENLRNKIEKINGLVQEQEHIVARKALVQHDIALSKQLVQESLQSERAENILTLKHVQQFEKLAYGSLFLLMISGVLAILQSARNWL